MKYALILFQFSLGLLLADDGQLNHYQVIGSHNSYHVAPSPGEEVFIRIRSEGQVKALQYTHPPLPEQFDSGIRQIELDLFADPEGGKYAQPAVFNLARISKGTQPPPLEDPEGLLQKPGTKILHFPNFDFRSTVLTLTQALTQTRDWSLAHPDHHPILILLELKGPANSWGNLAALEKEILNTIDLEHLLTPDLVRSDSADLRTAILSKGWPKRNAVRGKLMLALDNSGTVRANYLSKDPTIKGRLLFPSCPSERHPSAGFFKMNNPESQFERIKALSEKGFLIRTRADTDTQQARANDTKRRDRAFASGAHFISTDFAKANPDFSPYEVTLPKGAQEAYRFRQGD